MKHTTFFSNVEHMDYLFGSIRNYFSSIHIHLYFQSEWRWWTTSFSWLILLLLKIKGKLFGTSVYFLFVDYQFQIILCIILMVELCWYYESLSLQAKNCSKDHLNSVETLHWVQMQEFPELIQVLCFLFSDPQPLTTIKLTSGFVQHYQRRHSLLDKVHVVIFNPSIPGTLEYMIEYSHRKCSSVFMRLIKGILPE